MGPRPLNIDELKKIITKNIKKLDRFEFEFAKRCVIQLDHFEPAYKKLKDSERAKAEGNRLYGQKDLTFTRLYEILILYNKSIAFAPNDSEELAGAYANKSAVLLRMRKYRECIIEIDRALKITESMYLKVKLLCRKAACLTALGSSGNRVCLEKARFIVTKLEDTNESKQHLSKLIKKTQSTLDEDKLDIPKEDKRIIQAMEMIKEAEKRDVLESIRVEYSEKYGKHLVAVRDYKPGEIILTEKPYLNSVDGSRAYEYCCYCLAHLWTAVPCDSCARHVYCSEDCKTVAWKEYHWMDCLVLACMTAAFQHQWNGFIPLVVSFFCKALKEAGSIEQLLAEAKPSHRYEDQCSNNIVSDSNFTSYKDIYTVPFDSKRMEFNASVQIATMTLLGLAKCTKIFGKTYHFVNMKKLAKHETAARIGGLLLKFCMILFGSETDLLYLINPIEPNEDFEESDDQDSERSEERHPINANTSIPMLIMHIVNGCIPNVDSQPTHGNKYVLYALRPIKAGEQLIIQSTIGSVWDNTSKSERQLEHIKVYGCLCDCRACTEDWSHTLTDRALLSELVKAEMHCPSVLKLWDEFNSILSDWEINCHKPSYPDIKILSRIVELVTAAFKQLSMPSPLIVKSVTTLSLVLRGFYDRSEMYAKVPHLRPPRAGSTLDHAQFCSCESEQIVAQ